MPQGATVLTTLVTAVMVLTATAVPVRAEWTVKPAEGPGGRCVLESSRSSLSDGYQQTTVYFAVTPKSVALVSAAPLDAGSSDIGLKVDNEPFLRMDRLDGTKTALFDANYERVVTQFKAGTQVRVQLRFWPTWPATGTHSTSVSLIGFTKAYGELSGCR